ncbi:MAG: hypothetical protein ACRYHQ_24435 [Janthinobacterium lividum]
MEEPLPTDAPAASRTLQARTRDWLLACFGLAIAVDRDERRCRFLEEAVELQQACGGTRSEAHLLVDYVHGRKRGEVEQEVGGVALTLAALCCAYDIDMDALGERELTRVWGKVKVIRAKQAAKPPLSALPIATDAVGQYARLRALALKVAEGSSLWLDDEALVALAEDPDPAAWRMWSATKAEEGAAFLWRDPAQPDRIHFDRVGVDAAGMIDAKYGCGLDFYPDCQPARFEADVLEVMARVDARRG